MAVWLRVILCLGLTHYTSTYEGAHLGCYKDGDDRILEQFAGHIKLNVVESCILKCKNTFDMTFAGVEAGQECYCSNQRTYSSHGPVNASQCHWDCGSSKRSGDCGGSWRIDVFTVCPRGLYKRPTGPPGNCDYQCHCQDQQDICTYQWGDCPNGCTNGWLGDSCHLRDCTINNGGCQQQCKPNSRDSYCYCNDGYKQQGNNMSACHDNSPRSNPTVGIAVGVVLAILIAVLVAVVVIFLLRRRKQSKEDSDRKKEILSKHSVTNTTQAFAFQNECAIPKDESDNTVTPIPVTDTMGIEPVEQGPDEHSKFVKVGDLEEYVAQKKGDKKALKDELDEIPQKTAEYAYANQSKLRIKNRFKNILPYDNNRVILKSQETPLSDYINASYVRGYNNNEIFIASHGPSPTTLIDFWRMIWEMNVHIVVMVTNLVEDLKRKCEMYWPEEEVSKFGDFMISMGSESKWPDFTLRTLCIAKDGDSCSREVNQFHFTSWPDHGAPAYAAHLLRFRRKVREAMVPDVPTLVHCSAGVGRTGTFLALDWLLHQAEAEGGVDIYQCVHKLRKARMQMVQTVDQYLFLHTSLLEALTLGDTSSTVNMYPKVYADHERLSKQFIMLETLCPMLTTQETQTALQEENESKNRTDILPADKHRVHLMSSFAERNDYINAVYVPSYRKKNGYIVTQWPLNGTETDLWRMVYDYDLTSVVILEDLTKKLGSFLPSEDRNFDFKKITVVSNGKWSNDGVTVHDITVWHGKPPMREMMYMNTEEAKAEKSDTMSQRVTVLALADALSCQNIIALNKGLNNQDEESPTLLVCRDGANACGLYMAATSLMNMINIEKEIDIFYTVMQIKANRPEFVQSEEQYTHLHNLIMDYVEDHE